MKKNQLDTIGYIDDRLIEKADKYTGSKKKNIWIKWGTIAACLSLIVIVIVAVPRFITKDNKSSVNNNITANTPALVTNSDVAVQTAPVEGSEYVEGPWSPWMAFFNEPVAAFDASKKYIPGYFTEELSGEELDALEPALRWGDMAYSGFAGFDGNSNLIDVHIEIVAPHPERTVSLVISKDGQPKHYELSGEPVLSTYEQVDYTVYQWSPIDQEIYLEADAEISQYNYRFTMETVPEQIDKAKEDFQLILECFACWADGKPDMSVIKADAIPEFFDISMTFSEAQTDSEFGAYLPNEVPSGFAEESIRRYKDQNSNYLSGLWTKGYDELKWQITSFTEQDVSRLVSIDETEKYDLSLYPIPRADSVPTELREVVDNPIFIAEELTWDAVCSRAYKTGESGDGNGWRMAFSVKYNNVIVNINAKGVDPEWVYQQLVGTLTE